MRQQHTRNCIYLVVAIVVATMTGTCLGQELVLPEPVALPAADYGPFGVGGSARKPLPPVDCLHCFGPVPCLPCDTHHHGFLFYGTCHWDDDCADGDCGHVAAGLSRAWIRLHDHWWWPFQHSHGNGGVCCGGR